MKLSTMLWDKSQTLSNNYDRLNDQSFVPLMLKKPKSDEK